MERESERGREEREIELEGCRESEGIEKRREKIR